jgi:hypothetical protein
VDARVADEDIKLKDAVEVHGGMKWGLIATLVLGLEEKQCRSRWNGVFDPKNGTVSGRRVAGQ